MNDRFLTRIRELKFKQLLVFERVVTLGSMHKAAEALAMSQPNVFKIIGQLEELLDMPLFDRHSKGVLPTRFALRLLARVKPMLGDARAMGEELAALRSGERGQVMIGTLISASARLLPDAITLMKQRHPQVSVVVREATNDLLFPMLAVGELDGIVGRIPEASPPGIEYHRLYEEQLVVVARTSHPLAQRRGLRVQELLDYPWILPPHESSVRGQVDEFFTRHDLGLPANLIESISLLTNLGVLRQSDTIAMLPRTAAQPWIAAGALTALAINEVIFFGAIGIGLRAGRTPTPTASAFIDALKQAAQGLGA
ncbi:MAG: LysR family transcriptional regulator [Proteobacteria bacterium]|nr:LysR family transcriptional regulator [Pseudomonadota bacterium]